MFTTLMRKLVAVFLIAVFSVGLYSCGGSGGSHRSTPTEMTETSEEKPLDAMLDMLMDGHVDTLVTETTTIPIAAGESASEGYLMFSCAAGGPDCQVVITVSEVEGEADTLTYTGGMVTVGYSPEGMAQIELDTPKPLTAMLALLTDDHVDTLVTETTTIPIAAGESASKGYLMFSCAAGGPDCQVVITVSEVEGEADTLTYTGGMVTVGYSPEGMAQIELDTPKPLTAMLALLTDDHVDTLVTETTTIPIAAGESASKGYLMFSCAAGGPDCQVVITVSEVEGEADTLTYTGGMVTVGYSPEGMAQIASENAAKLEKALAIAEELKSLTDNNADDNIPDSGVIDSTDPKLTVTRTTKGYTIEVVDAAPSYSKTGSAPAISGWYGETQQRTPRRAPKEDITVYTNIDPAQGLFYEDYIDSTDTRASPPAGAVKNPDAANKPRTLDLDGGNTDQAAWEFIEATAFPDSPTTTEEYKEDRRFEGTFNGIPGYYECTTATCSAKGREEGGVSLVTGEWEFTPKAMEYYVDDLIADDDYLYFGYWLRTPSETTDNYKFSTFYGGAKSYPRADGNLALSNQDTPVLTGSATYNGGAAGMYVMKENEFLNQKIETVSANHGNFTAKASLTAHFGQPAGGGINVADLFTIRGNLSEFKDGNDNLGFNVTFEPARIGTGTDVTAFDANAKGTFNGIQSDTGSWKGQFFGGPETAPTEVAKDYPTGVAGQFSLQSQNADLAGAFGATTR